MLQNIIVIFVLVWFIVYILAYVVFMLPSKDESITMTSSQAAASAGIDSLDPHAERILSRSISSSGVKKKSNKLADTPFVPSSSSSSSSSSPSMLHDPFLSEACLASIEGGLYGTLAPQSFLVVIPVRNEAKEYVLHTVASVLANSGAACKKIVLVDDHSLEPVKAYSEWKQVPSLASAVSSGLVQVVVPPHRVGVAGAKAYGAAQRTSEDVLVFLDAHVVVSPSWLLPLAHALDKSPHSIVYPAIDVIDPSTGNMAQAENVVAAFSWSLDLRWEPLLRASASSSPRVFAHTQQQGLGKDDLAFSPAAPGIFAIKHYYYESLGGFDTALFPWGQESIEISLRSWMCGGGGVLRQPCSRVAHRYDNLFAYTEASHMNGVTQAAVDLNVMTVAEHWMLPTHRELVYQARFTGRIPYSVELDWDSRQPKAFLNIAKLKGNDQCLDFDWFLQEVYPGLLLDAPQVTSAYSEHVLGNFEQTSLDYWTKQYQGDGASAAAAAVQPVDPNVQATLIARASVDAELAIEEKHKKWIPLPIYYPKSGKKSLSKLDIARSPDTDPHERHANLVRETLVCEDEKDVPHSQPCSVMVGKDPTCMKNRYYMMFGCPKACNLCGTDGNICFDFYEGKCPQYKEAGRCVGDEEEQMKHDCRLSCGHCTPAKNANAKVAIAGQAAAAAVAAVAEKQQLPKAVAGAAAAAVAAAAAAVAVPVDATKIVKAAGGLSDAGVDPFVAQRDYKAGAMDSAVATSVDEACSLKGLPNGQLLAKIALASSPPPLLAGGSGGGGGELGGGLLAGGGGGAAAGGGGGGGTSAKIFCGIYTMEKNHGGNVKATRETWAKKCDGFVAYSTITDALIPAFKIEHEGDEAYDNMWQKSRAIWKHVAAHFLDEFDYFLMGGDDMFYIIENLRAYLSSPEITALSSAGKGLFLGRRFFPPGQKVFNSGGAGYLLDRAALQKMAKFLDDPACFPHQRGFWEDVNIANCLRVAGDILPYDTRDSLGRERFHPFTPGQHLTYRIPAINPDWYPKYNPYLKEGFDCCSPESISFHYVPAELMYKLNSFTYSCPTKE